MAYRFGASLGQLLRVGFHAMPIVVVATGVWAVTFLPGIWTSMAAWLVRGICVILWVWHATILFRAVGKRTALAAPLFLIVSIALWFHAMIPVIFAFIMVKMDGAVLERLMAVSTIPELFSSFIGSDGELAVLRFSLIGIAASAWVLPADSREQKGEESNGNEGALPPERVAVALGIFTAGIYILVQYMPADGFGLVWVEWLRQIKFAALAMFLASYSLVAMRCANRKGGAVAYLILLSIVAVGPILAGGLKAIIFIFLSSGLIVALAMRSIKLIIGGIIALMIVLVLTVAVRQSVTTYPLEITDALISAIGSETRSITISGMPAGTTLSAGARNVDGTWTLTPSQLVGLKLTVQKGGSIDQDSINLSVIANATEAVGRDTKSSPERIILGNIISRQEAITGPASMGDRPGGMEYVIRTLSAKLIARQVESVDCLSGVIRAHSICRKEILTPFYFLVGLVPSVLWRDKPDLSQSGITVLQYCDPSFAPNIHTGHSASATLLWEPLAQAGVQGQIVAQTLLFLTLIVLSRLWISGGSFVAAGVLALTPWTIDFDQHFALYVANLAKAGLVTGAFLFVLARVGRILRWR